ncbi:polysaccharide pyruvyl transferase CsaB [Spirulina major]|uniref:polysaccharide pyruvyl transferase CsaB n=1 Tax=Spirulina major TaxID=270636 RepID=UPI000932889E|nr:polysaccharide pyruvyl transferase CsaB [Spirulina major]
MGKKAILCGYYGKGNGGDEALLATLLQMLPENVQPIVLSGNPMETYKRYGVESCDRNSALALWDACRKADYFIWGGGSLMQDATSWASPIYYGGVMGLAQQQGLTCLAWGQGIGPLKRPFTRWLTKQVLQGCAAVSVRDRASANLVQQWDITPVLAPDPVWALTAEPWTGKPWPRPTVAVTLRPHPTLTRDRLHTLITALAQFQTQTDVHLLLVPFQASQDGPLAEAIAAQLPQPVEIIHEPNPYRLKGLFQQVDLAIGMRLHSLIMAASEGCRCVALSYDPKVTQLMASVGLAGWELTDLPTDADAIAAQWQASLAQEPMGQDAIALLKTEAQWHRDLLNMVINPQT